MSALKPLVSFGVEVSKEATTFVLKLTDLKLTSLPQASSGTWRFTV